eukprot:3821569-Amphidinium_carterae.1
MGTSRADNEAMVIEWSRRAVGSWTNLPKYYKDTRLTAAWGMIVSGNDVVLGFLRLAKYLDMEAPASRGITTDYLSAHLDKAMRSEKSTKNNRAKAYYKAKGIGCQARLNGIARASSTAEIWTEFMFLIAAEADKMGIPTFGQSVVTKLTYIDRIRSADQIMNMVRCDSPQATGLLQGVAKTFEYIAVDELKAEATKEHMADAMAIPTVMSSAE